MAHQRCLEAVNNIFAGDGVVNHMITSLNELGCPVGRQFFICEPCENKFAGGMFHSGRGVIICENNERSQYQTSRTMRHELTHAYDLCRVEYDARSCLHHACTEVRAAALSGDCNWSMEVLRGYGHHVSNHKAKCVQRQATTSVSMNPACAHKAQQSVQAAFTMCYADIAPFDAIPEE